MSPKRSWGSPLPEYGLREPITLAWLSFHLASFLEQNPEMADAKIILQGCDCERDMAGFSLDGKDLLFERIDSRDC